MIEHTDLVIRSHPEAVLVVLVQRADIAGRQALACATGAKGEHLCVQGHNRATRHDRRQDTTSLHGGMYLED